MRENTKKKKCLARSAMQFTWQTLKKKKISRETNRELNRETCNRTKKWRKWYRRPPRLWSSSESLKSTKMGLTERNEFFLFIFLNSKYKYMEPLSRFFLFFFFFFFFFSLNGSVGLFRGLNSKLKSFNPPNRVDLKQLI